VDVFQFGLELKLALFDLLPDRFKSPDDGLAFGGGDDLRRASIRTWARLPAIS
jgi:hypothetical protein